MRRTLNFHIHVTIEPEPMADNDDDGRLELSYAIGQLRHRLERQGLSHACYTQGTFQAGPCVVRVQLQRKGPDEDFSPACVFPDPAGTPDEACGGDAMLQYPPRYPRDALCQCFACRRARMRMHEEGDHSYCQAGVS